MNKQIIIYGSQYGSTKRYAERLSEITGLDAINYKKVKDIGDYKRIVYFGGLFAGGVMGLKKTVNKMTFRQELILATVGMTDPMKRPISKASGKRSRLSFQRLCMTKKRSFI